MNYRSCTLQKQSTRKGAWVAEDIAKIGTVLEVNGDHGWEICALSSVVFPLELALTQSSDPIAKSKS